MMRKFPRSRTARNALPGNFLFDHARKVAGAKKNLAVQADRFCQGLLPLHAFTSICCVEYVKRVESVFEVIAEPNRRAILSLLVSSQQSFVGIERQLRMPQATVSKHLRVLREAGFVQSTVDAQRRLYRLKPEPLEELDAWLAPFRRFWSAHVDALESHLDRMDDSTLTKRKNKETTTSQTVERDKEEK